MKYKLRLFFAHFSTNMFLAGRGGTGYKAQMLKKALKNTILPQITFAKLPKITNFPIAINYIFITTHDYDIDNYNIMAKYITDCLVFRGILPDDNQNIINSYSVLIQKIDKKNDEGCIVFIKTK